jgi:hypothetical protein
VQGRDAEQSSDALGAAASQVGPRALALAGWLHKSCGMPLAKVCALFAHYVRTRIIGATSADPVLDIDFEHVRVA